MTVVPGFNNVRVTVGCMLALLLLAGCRTQVDACSVEEGMARVSGTLDYLPRSALPAEAMVQVQLVDVSLADAKALLLGETIFEAAGSLPPLEFAIAYQAAQIKANHSYALQARISVNGQLLYISDKHYAVLTRGAPAHMDIQLKAIGSR